LAKLPTGLWSRGTKLIGVASKVALNEISSRVKTWEDEKTKLESKIELAQSLVKTMSELKGASMKLGQMMSMDLGDYLPPEAVKVLENLHQNATFLPFNEVEAILKSELGDKLLDISEISQDPIAAASIGQVHSAKLNGKDIVLKVQYPNVANSIPTDLKLLKIILKNFSVYQGKDVNLDPFFKEVEEVLLKETDYENEQAMLLKYEQAFKNSDFIIPKVYSDYCTKKVIALEMIDGKKITEWKKTSLLGERMALGKKFIELYLEEFFTHGLVQTDPNPGNFFITEGNKIALLDFGAVKEYERVFIDGYRKVLIAAFENNRSSLLKISEELAFIDPRESQEVKAIYLDMMEILAAPFRQAEPFDFSNKQFFEDSKNLSWKLSKACRFSPPPKDLLFLHRKLAGVFGIVKRLEIKLVLRDYWYLVEKI
jgi:aarF domain-containing kinase